MRWCAGENSGACPAPCRDPAPPAPPLRCRPRPSRRRPGAGGAGRGAAAGEGRGGSGGSAMVGRLSLREVPDLPDMRKRGDAGLDSPDSGLPPSPGPAPSPWLLSSGSPDRAATNGLPEPDPSAPAAAVSTGTGRPRHPSCSAAAPERGGTLRPGPQAGEGRGTSSPGHPPPRCRWSRARSRCGGC